MSRYFIGGNTNRTKNMLLNITQQKLKKIFILFLFFVVLTGYYLFFIKIFSNAWYYFCRNNNHKTYQSTTHIYIPPISIPTSIYPTDGYT